MKALVAVVIGLLVITPVYATGGHSYKGKICKIKTPHKHWKAPVYEKSAPKSKTVNKNTAKASSKSESRASAKSKAVATAKQNQHQNQSQKATGGKASSTSRSEGSEANNSLNVEGDNYPKIAMAVPPSISSECTIGAAGQGIKGGLSSSFPEAACQAMFLSDSNWRKFVFYRDLGREYNAEVAVLGAEYVRLDGVYNTLQYKAVKGYKSEELYRTLPAMKAKLDAARNNAGAMFERAEHHLSESQRWEDKSSSIISREVVTGEIGGHIARIIPIGAVLRAFNAGD